MSFEASHQRPIQAGDTVIIYQSPTSITAIEISSDPKAAYACKFGNFKHKEMIGLPFGSKISSDRRQKGFITLLYPTPELWTLALSHRTQILYLADISYIVANLEMKPGSVVIEAGTGSGSFSHSIGRAVAPNGHLYTFEYHQQRADLARAEFEKHKLGNVITVTHRDVCQDGFGVTDVADAVFLDLPMPWVAIPHAKIALKKSVIGRICCFSPCIEQVQKNAEALRTSGFTEIKTVEVLLKYYYPQELPFAIPLPTEESSSSSSSGEPKSKKRRTEEEGPSKKEVVLKPIKEMRGHTSYLTFASLLPPYEEKPELLNESNQQLVQEEGEEEEEDKEKEKEEKEEEEAQE